MADGFKIANSKLRADLPAFVPQAWNCSNQNKETDMIEEGANVNDGGKDRLYLKDYPPFVPEAYIHSLVRSHPHQHTIGANQLGVEVALLPRYIKEIRAAAMFMGYHKDDAMDYSFAYVPLSSIIWESEDGQEKALEQAGFTKNKEGAVPAYVKLGPERLRSKA